MVNVEQTFSECDGVSRIGNNTQILLSYQPTLDLIYWGKVISTSSFSSDMIRMVQDRAVPYGRLDQHVPLGLMPELTRGVFSSPMLEGHREGKDWSPVFTHQFTEILENGWCFLSEDSVAQLRLITELRLDDTDVLQIRHRLTNLGEGTYDVHRLACTLPIPGRANEILNYHGRWIKEFQTSRQTLLHGGYQQENRRGRTSHEHFPALVVGTPQFGETQGEVWGCHFAWSGNHRMRVDVKADGRRFVQAEVIYFPGEIRLAQQESIETPWLYASYSSMGLNGMSQQFHQFVRQRILLPSVKNTPRPVHLNTWEGIYFDHDPAYIYQMATEAAQLGVERFIVDDGWFSGRLNDKSGLGDWFVDENKYPDGLMPLIEHVKGLGMQFGLWFEPEMVNKSSELYRQHPDWLLAVPEYETPTGRHQHVLDLQNSAVFEYLLLRLDHFLFTYPIDYIKWDMNREIVQPAHQGQASGYQQVCAYYRLLDEVRKRHPKIEIESCAAGGGRIDYEVLKRTHRFWASDNNDALERQRIQKGMSYFFPPEVMGCHIGAFHSHSTRRRHDIGFRGVTALLGHMGIELDPVVTSEKEKADFRRYIDHHKKCREWIHHGRYVRLPMDNDDDTLAYGVISADSDRMVLVVAQLQMPTYAFNGELRIPYLNAESVYHVDVLDCPENLHAIAAHQPNWLKGESQFTGVWLEEMGLVLPILDPETALLVQLIKVG